MSSCLQTKPTRADADPALSFEGLDDFFPEDRQQEDLAVPSDQELFPARTASAAITWAAPSIADPALAVDGLDDFFSEDQEDDLAVAITATAPSTALDSALEVGGLDDYFRGRDESETALEDPAFQSEIQRSVMEFQRFAEKFHAFATECQQR